MASALKIASEIFFEPLFTEESIEKERGAILTEIRQRMDQSWYKLGKFFRETRFKRNHPLVFDTGGSIEIVEKLSRRQIVDFWSSYFKTSNIHLLVVGNFLNQNLEKLVQTYFDQKPSFGQRPLGQVRSIQLKKSDLSNRKIAIRPDFNLQSTTVDLSFPSLSSDNDLKLRVTQGLISAIFGQLQTSRLYKILRLQRGLVYGVHTGASFYPGLGYVHISSQVIPQNLDEVLNIIVHSLEELIQNGVTEEELNFAKNFLTNQWLMAFDNPATIADWIRGELLWEETIRLPEDYIKMVQKIKVSDLQKLIKNIGILIN